MSRRFTSTAVAAIAILALAGCSGSPTPDAPDQGTESSGDGHGAIAGATEVAEPQLHLVAVDADGALSMLDLLDSTETSLDPVEAATSVTTDGRYVFAANDTGVSILDSGVWTWDHVDHFHYYRADPRLLPRVTGEGVATVSTGMLSTAGTTGVYFPDSGDAILLHNKALSRGEVKETLRVETTPHAGLIVPLDTGALISESDTGDLPDRLRAVDADGTELDAIDCEDAAGSITTRVAVVVGCADGAVLATSTDGAPSLTHLPYPDAAHAAATSFSARKGRPTVAGLGDGNGIWLLDTREQAWQWLPTTTPVIAAAAVDDAGEHVVAVGSDGIVQVYSAETGQLLAATDSILADTLADPELAAHVALMVDGQRAYVNAAADGVVFEIDYADSARVARTLELPTSPFQFAEVGR